MSTRTVIYPALKPRWGTGIEPAGTDGFAGFIEVPEGLHILGWRAERAAVEAAAATYLAGRKES